MQSYIKRSSRNINKSFYEKNLWNTKIYIKDDLPQTFDIDLVIDKLKSLVEPNYFNLVDYIMIGNFELLIKRELDAAYDNGTIYLSNDQEDEEDMVDDIIHELAHAVEEKYDQTIYEDGNIKSEFLAKRQRLFHILEEEIEESLDLSSFMNPNYSLNFDNFLYYDVGYPLLNVLTSELFYSSYAITSIREYFANGFEAFYYDRGYKKLKDLSPSLYEKISIIDSEVKDGI